MQSTIAKPLYGQDLQIYTHHIDTGTAAIPLGINDNYANSQGSIAQIRKIVPALQEQGYLAASIDSIRIVGNECHIYYFQGQQYRWGNLSFDSIPSPILIAAGINKIQYSNRPLTPSSIAKICEKLLLQSEENGYPFTKVWLAQVQQIAADKINAYLMIDRAELRKIDTIIVNADLNISHSFLQRYLDIMQGSVYNEKKMKMINQRILELPFLQMSSPWMLHFRPGDTRLSLFLKEKKANQLNAILGLMPNNLESNKLLLTADVQFALQNYLGHGESLSASFQNLQAHSPRFKADVVVPYVFKSPIGVEAHFDFFMNNLQFRKVSFQTGIRYQINSSDMLRLFYQVSGNRIITIDTASIIATKQLPNNIDVTTNGLGFELNLNRTNYRLNPRKGWYAKLSTTVLQRKILSNSGIAGIKDGSGFNYGSLYDTINKSSYVYHFNADIAQFIPLGKSVTLKLGYLGAYIAAPRVFQNELFQIGGFKLLRGFDEQSIFANQFHVSVVELRYLFSQNSYAYLFSDNAWVQTKFNNYDRAGFYNGFGLGTTLETKTGIFSIALAFGKSEFNDLKFRESKISFGYVALF
ncbi:MAG: BamA/TamA family outer membrane protein [Phycisphaerales bacterium]|nr:BamA/TamA family outer membrane protein [Phycisphaerales bacterium]